MNYDTLSKAARKKTVRAVITGAGEFGTAFIFQSQRVPGLEVSAVCNRTIERGLAAVTRDKVVSPVDSSLLRLRTEQDTHFQSGK